MNLIKLTPEKANQFIDNEIIFKTHGNNHVKKIISVSKSEKSIKIDHPVLQDCLQ